MCLRCEDTKTLAEFKKKVVRSRLCKCECGGLLKPRVVFYGEELPMRFYNNVEKVCRRRGGRAHGPRVSHGLRPLPRVCRGFGVSPVYKSSPEHCLTSSGAGGILREKVSFSCVKPTPSQGRLRGAGGGGCSEMLCI